MVLSDIDKELRGKSVMIQFKIKEKMKYNWNRLNSYKGS